MAKKKGLYWHCHHEILLEYCYDYDERVEFVKTSKPQNEVKERLRVFQPVKGKLPKEIVKAWEACDKAWEAYVKAREPCVKAWEAYVKAWEAYVKAREPCDKAVKANKAAIEKLHAQECPDCTWNGKRLVFSMENKNG